MARRPYLELEASKHAEAIRILREQFPHEDENSEAFHDTLEGMTDFYEALDAIMEEHRKDVAWAEICQKQAEELIQRGKRLSARAERIKARILTVLEAVGLPGVQRPAYTLSRAEGPRRAIVTNMDLLPEKYIRRKPAPPPEPDLVAIGKALKSDDPNERSEVAMAALLGNGNPRLDVRRK